MVMWTPILHKKSFSAHFSSLFFGIFAYNYRTLEINYDQLISAYTSFLFYCYIKPLINLILKSSNNISYFSPWVCSGAIW